MSSASEVAALIASGGKFCQEHAPLLTSPAKGSPAAPGPSPATKATGPRDIAVSINLEPMGAPRMNRGDAWKKRPVVLRYRAFKDALRAAVGAQSVPDALVCHFTFPMPPSWSNKKREFMRGKPHRQKPDRDNLEKAVMDALFQDDSGVWRGHQEKRWGDAGRIDLTLIWL